MSERIAQAQIILRALGLPAEQQNERAALTLLALLNLSPQKDWVSVENPRIGITPIMAFVSQQYSKYWAPNTRETVRRFTMHQFLAAGLVVANPDKPDRAVNSPHNVYQIEPVAQELIRTFGTPEWDDNLTAYRELRQSLVERYAQERVAQRIPVQISPDQQISLSPGGQNVLIQKVEELRLLFQNAASGLVFVTAFLDRQTFRSYLSEIAWETEVWVANAPTHLIHFNGKRFLGPYSE